MIELVSTTSQTVLSGKAVPLTAIALHTGCAERHRSSSSIVSLVKPGIYLITANLDIAIPTGGTVGAITAALAVDGEALPGSDMTSTPAAVNNFNNISTSHLVKVCFPCCVEISIINTSTQSILMQNVNLTVERKA